MLSVRRVLFPTDLSEGAKRAFPQAAHFADWHDAELHILNVTGRHRHDYEETKEHFFISDDMLAEWLRRPSKSVSGSTWPDLEALPITQTQVESTEPAERVPRQSHKPVFVVKLDRKSLAASPQAEAVATHE